jgi:EAL domain-containing protein (putative c-di-GMP-specific phosphodiesterase class I)
LAGRKTLNFGSGSADRFGMLSVHRRIDPARNRRFGDPREPDPALWAAALREVLVDPTQPEMVFQPIIDLARGVVVGHEALSRFRGPPSAAPDRWFAVAADHEVADRLEAKVIRAALRSLDVLPPDTFLTVNVDPNLLTTREVEAALAERTRLDRLVLEITEHAPVRDYPSVLAALETYRRAGALVAVDDAGAGYAGLHHVPTVRPELVKLDRSLIVDVDQDPAKRALVEMIGEFAGRVDAWILAEGVERVGELEELVRLGVALAQGYLFGRPTGGWTRDLAAPVADVIRRARLAVGSVGTLAPLLERAPTVRDDALDDAMELFLDDPSLAFVVVIDGRSRPRGLYSRGAAIADRRVERRILAVDPGEAPPDVALRAAARAPGQRYDPVVCTDGRGAYVGTVGIDRLLATLTQSGGGD